MIWLWVAQCFVVCGRLWVRPATLPSNLILTPGSYPVYNNAKHGFRADADSFLPRPPQSTFAPLDALNHFVLQVSTFKSIFKIFAGLHGMSIAQLQTCTFRAVAVHPNTEVAAASKFGLNNDEEDNVGSRGRYLSSSSSPGKTSSSSYPSCRCSPHTGRRPHLQNACTSTN